ncbi:hypothetical protein DFH09DRAFT_1375353 [Mycena vulgaris]|nr:hypothetical protein DFH09DRAFT_1375353 [Mycena vulgaris]
MTVSASPPILDEGIMNLHAVTPDNRRRYTAPFTGLVHYKSMTIPAELALRGSSPGPDNLPPLWSHYIHPEGRMYFCLRLGVDGDGSSALSIVTESRVDNPDTMARLMLYIEQLGPRVDKMCLRHGMARCDIEVYLQLEEDGCGYYLVNLKVKTMFWLDDQTTEDIDLVSGVTSRTHLSLELTALFFSHLEHFSMHLGSKGPEIVSLKELPCVLAYDYIDKSTSRDSTSVLSAAQYATALETLERVMKGDNLTNGHVICLAAKLWYLIYSQRARHFYGDEHCRLSRSQAVLYDPATKYRFISVLASWFSFNLSWNYLLQLDGVYFDHIVIESQWKTTMTDFIGDWTDTLQGTSILLLLHVFFIVLDADRNVAAGSAGLLGASFVMAKALLHRCTPLQNLTAGEASDYLESIHSKTFKFQFVALMFAFPRALQYWGLLGFLVNCGIIFIHHFGTIATIVLAATSGLLVLFFLWTTSASFNYVLSEICGGFTRFGDFMRMHFQRFRDFARFSRLIVFMRLRPAIALKDEEKSLEK